MPLTDYFSNSWFLGIAIDKYDHFESLLTPVRDVQAVGQQLTAPNNGFRSRILAGQETSAHGIRAFLEEMVATVNGGADGAAENRSRLVFYFAGHGKTLENADGSATGYIIPRDGQVDAESSWISMDSLLAEVYKVGCRHVLLILDCCFAGSLEWSVFNTRDIRARPKKIYRQHFSLYVRDRAWQVITSAAFDQTSLDQGWRRKEQGYSPFASALVDGLKGEADLLKNGLITAAELIVYVRDTVEKLANDEHIRHRQTPRLFTLKHHDKGEFLFLNPNRPLRLEDAVAAVKENNPFKGLESYEEKDRPRFYGRSKVSAAIVEMIRERHADPRLMNLLIVSGISGSGKSSVIKAGVKPLLQEQGWIFPETIRPGETPLRMLEKWDLTKGPGTKTILFVDQLEELVTQARNKDDAETFLNRLYDLCMQHEEVFVLATLRSDYLYLINRGKWAPFWKTSTYSIPWLDRMELRETILRPALDIAFFYEPVALVDEIIDDVLQYPGSLPLLSVLLSELFVKSIENSRNRLLHEDDYRAIGGIAGALHSKLRGLLGNESANEYVLKSILLRMINIEGDIYSRRKASVEDLRFGEREFDQVVEAEIRVLLKQRIIYPVEGSSVGWEPVHDAVARWGYIKKWIEEIGIARMGMQRDLENAVDGYAGKNDLWDRNDRLEVLVGELPAPEKGRPAFLMNHREREFIVRSRDARTHGRRVQNALIGVSFVVLAGFAVVAWYLKSSADKQRNVAQENLKQYQRAKFKEDVQNGNVYQEAVERSLADTQFSYAYSIYKELETDSLLRQEADQYRFDTIIRTFKLDGK
ncbi:MAG TPA: caspase family protein [Puia sp.]|nr:caspase family protein [Puia sp.]